MKPTKINILGKTYSVKYFDKPLMVDPEREEELWGRIEYFPREIRIYNNKNPEDLFETLLHEVLHGIETELHLDIFDTDEGHRTLSVLSVALSDFLIRNDFIQLEEGEENESSICSRGIKEQ